MKIDINCDLGEGFPHDAEIMPFISSANINDRRPEFFFKYKLSLVLIEQVRYDIYHYFLFNKY